MNDVVLKAYNMGGTGFKTGKCSSICQLPKNKTLTACLLEKEL